MVEGTLGVNKLVLKRADSEKLINWNVTAAAGTPQRTIAIAV